METAPPPKKKNPTNQQTKHPQTKPKQTLSYVQFPIESVFLLSLVQTWEQGLFSLKHTGRAR